MKKRWHDMNNTTTPKYGDTMLFELGRKYESGTFFTVCYWNGKVWVMQTGEKLDEYTILAHHPLPERAQVVQENTDLATEIERELWLKANLYHNTKGGRDAVCSTILNAINRFRKERK
jgi:hypothetical protein